MNSSESIKALSAALAKALPEIDKADKNKENPHFRSKYADLGNVVDAIKPALQNHGLTFTQICHDTTSAATVETVVLHESGEWLSCGLVSVPVSKNDAQGFGSALTYARRYSLSAAFGVAPEDDDGNAAAKNAPKDKPAEKKADLSEAQKSLLAEIDEYAVANNVFPADILKEVSHYKTDKGEGHLKMEDLTKPNTSDKFQRWVGASLKKLRDKVKESK